MPNKPLFLILNICIYNNKSSWRGPPSVPGSGFSWVGTSCSLKGISGEVCPAASHAVILALCGLSWLIFPWNLIFQRIKGAKGETRNFGSEISAMAAWAVSPVQSSLPATGCCLWGVLVFPVSWSHPAGRVCHSTVLFGKNYLQKGNLAPNHMRSVISATKIVLTWNNSEDKPTFWDKLV